MKFFQEVTVWADSPSSINHIYYMDDNKTAAVGYLKFGKGRLIKFKNPLKIDIRGRKFVELKDKKGEPDSKYFVKSEEFKPKDAIIVKGSNGKEYQITKVGNQYSCTCPGFMFRHKCKHIEEMSKK